MAAAVRLLWLLFLQALTLVSAYHPSTIHPQSHTLLPRKPIISNSSGTVQVFDPNSQSVIPQVPATDGGGSDFNVPALIWIGFSLVIGIPLACAGIRGWRLTTGTGVGLAAMICAWAALNNTISAPGLSDILITLISIGFFGLGFALGVFEFARLGAIVLLSLSGGVAFGTRIVLIKQGLLVSNDNLYAANLAIIAVFGGAAGLSLIWAQRASILLACASVGTFLTTLGFDLIINKQAGLSRGLRFLFDRNDSHLADLVVNGYTPPLLTSILIIASLVLTPVLAFAQHKIFKQPFTRRSEVSDAELGIDFPADDVENKRTTFFASVFESGSKLRSPNRFSL